MGSCFLLGDESSSISSLFLLGGRLRTPARLTGCSGSGMGTVAGLDAGRKSDMRGLAFGDDMCASERGRAVGKSSERVKSCVEKL